MITDPLFYRLFATSPETFFLVLGLSADAATQMAARYEYDALEFKETSHRIDGVFRPKEPGLPLYFVEVQFYRLANVFAGLLVKAFSYLKLHDPGQPFHGVVLFATRELEPKGQDLYQPLFDAGLIQRFYLDEMPESADAPLGLSILSVIRRSETEAPEVARRLVARTKREIDDEALRAELIELIETVIIYKLPRLTREEIQAMLQVHDIRETRVYQEAMEEGFEKGVEQARLQALAKMAARNIAPDDIAAILGLDIEVVRAELAKLPR